MRNLFLAVLTASILGCGVAAHAACPIPNPNNTPIESGGFFDGCTLSAAGLNELLQADKGSSVCAPITLFGGKADGITDNVAAFVAAMAANPTRPCVSFPPGIYLFNQNVTVTLPSNATGFSILGAGPGVSTLFWPTGAGGIKLVTANDQPCRFANFDMTTGVPGGGTALDVSNTAVGGNVAGCVFDHIALHGSDGYNLQHNYWTTNILLNAMSNVNVINSGLYGGQSLGDGINYEAGTHGAITSVLNIIGSNIYSMNRGVIYGTGTQGVTIEGGSNIVGGNYGVVSLPGAVGQDQLTITGSEINTCIIGVNLQGGSVFTQISSSIFIPGGGSSSCPNAIGINIASNIPFQIQGNGFQAGGPNATGIKISNGSGRIEGNLFQTLAVGVQLTAGVEFFVTQGRNTFESDVTTTYLNQIGAETDGYGLWPVNQPVITTDGTVGVPVYTVHTAAYNRMGQWITTNFHIALSSWAGSPTGNLFVQTLPFTNTSGDVGVCSISTASGITLGAGFTYLTGRIEPSTTRMGLFEGVPGGAMQAVAASQVTPGTFELLGTCNYHTGFPAPNGDG